VRWGVIGLAVVATASTAHADREPVEALPVVATIDGPTPVVVRGDLSIQQSRRAERIARAVYRDVSRRFLHARDDTEHDPVDVCLFATERAYTRFVDQVVGDDDYSRMGFYLGSKRLVVANLARGIGNLRHELVHALIGDDYPRLPTWLNEGMGSLYGTARPGKTGFRFLVNYRLRHLQAAMKADRLPTLDDLATAGRAELYGNRGGTYYALSRYVLLYMEQRGTLDEFYEKMYRSDAPRRAHLALLFEYVDYDDFVTWAKALRYRKKRRRR